jgi:hypothetical protein
MVRTASLAAIVVVGLPSLAAATDVFPASSVTGRVVDAITDRPIAGAQIEAGGTAVVADDAGHFGLQLPPGTWILNASANGYTAGHVNAEIQDGRRVDVAIFLVPEGLFREQVEVVAPGEAVEGGPAAIPVRPAEVVGVAGGGENIFRALQTLPGVAGTDEFSSRLSVRGGGPDQNLTVMDGVEIHNPYRLYGFVSAFNPETVERFELTTGAFNARYGDRLSSLLVVENRAGSSERVLTGSAALSLTDTNLILEGRLPRGRGSWLVTGRRTYYDLVAERFTDNDLPSFNDLQGKVVLSLGQGRTLSVLALRSRETTDASFDIESEHAQAAILSKSKNELVAATLRAPLGQRGWARTIVSTSTNTDVVDFEGSFRDDERRSNSPDPDSFGTAQVDVAWEGTVRDRSLRQELQWGLGPRHVLSAGGELHALRTQVGWTIVGSRNQAEGDGSSLNGGASLPDVLDSARDDTRLGAFIADHWQISQRLTLEPGVRLDRSTINARTTFSPRLAASWSLTPATRLRLALGLHTQTPGYEKLVQSDYFMDLSGAGPLPLDSQRAQHALLGLERDLPSGMLVRVEGYYKGFDRLIVGRVETPGETAARIAEYDFPADLSESVPNHPQVTSFPTNDGRGRAWGLDLYLARRAARRTTRLSGWVSYSLGWAERTSFGRTYPFDYDRRHALNLVASFRVNPRLELATTARVASGFPFTPVRGLRVAATPDAGDLDGDGNRDELIPERDAHGALVYTVDRGGLDNLNSARLPFYARVDTRATFTPGWGRGRVQLYVDVMNVLARGNASAIMAKLEHDPGADRPRITEERLTGMPFLPSLGVHVTFGTPKWQGAPRPKKSECGAGDVTCAAVSRPGGFAIGARAGGTRGPGIDAWRRLSARFNLRVGTDVPASFKYSEDAGGGEYDVKVKLGATTALLNWHPFAGSFHLSGGVFASRHGFELDAKPAGEYTLAGERYAAADVGVLSGTASVRRVGPYIGLGWGNPFKRKGRFGLVVDLGLVPQGGPRVRLGATGPLAGDPAFEAALTREAAELTRRLHGWRLFPVVTVGTSLRL